MTVFENIKQMSIDELTGWIDKYGMFDNSPWINWFDKTYCNKCESEKVYVEESGREMECAWCEIYDRCKFFQHMDKTPDTLQMVKLWLESEYKNE